MSITVEGLRDRLGLLADADSVLELVISDTVQAIQTLTGVKRLEDDWDGQVYAACMDVYRNAGYGSAASLANVQSVKDRDQTVQFKAASNTASAVDIVRVNHAAFIRRVRKVRW